MRACDALVDATGLGALRELSLSRCRIKNNALASLSRGGALAHLTHLDLSGTRLDPKQARALFEPVPFPNLRELDLTEVTLTRSLDAALSGVLPTLERLILDDCRFDRGELARLFRGDYTPPLETLSLRGTTHLDEGDLRALFTASNLRHLWLPFHAPSRSSASLLLEHLIDLPKLTRLNAYWPGLALQDARFAFLRVGDDQATF